MMFLMWSAADWKQFYARGAASRTSPDDRSAAGRAIIFPHARCRHSARSSPPSLAATA